MENVEKELRALGAFLEGFSEALNTTPTGRAEAERVGIDLRRS
jgi:hypothetical protein